MSTQDHDRVVASMQNAEENRMFEVGAAVQVGWEPEKGVVIGGNPA